MKRKLIPLLLLVTSAVWLVGSYLPQGVVPWRTIPGDGMDGFLRVAVVVSALLFALIQVILVASVFKFPQRVSRHDGGHTTQDSTDHSAPEATSVAGTSCVEESEIVIKRRWELFWTVTPLVASLALFVVSYWALSG
jgi:heme/copper-type cytochrome/quinol oxidase subunit 2